MCGTALTAKSSARSPTALWAIVEYKDADNGKPWVKIVDHKTKKPIGWVR